MPLRYVDPHKRHSRRYETWVNLSRSRPGQFLAHHLWPHVDPWLYRASGGRYPAIFGGPSTAPLMTTGAKSGQPREHQITYFHDGPDPIVIASNYGGPKHPQWYYNLKAHRACELGDEKFVATEIPTPRNMPAYTGSRSRSTPVGTTTAPRPNRSDVTSRSSGSHAVSDSPAPRSRGWTYGHIGLAGLVEGLRCR